MDEDFRQSQMGKQMPFHCASLDAEFLAGAP